MSLSENAYSTARLHQQVRTNKNAHPSKDPESIKAFMNYRELGSK